jgi:hypothetical protein
MKNINFKLLAVIVTLVLILGFFLNAGEALAAPSCPFSPQAGRTIVNFDGTKIFSSGGLPQITTYTTLAPGQYNISLFAYDEYATRNTVSQPNEKYYIRLLANDNTVLVKTASTRDLPDYVTLATVSDRVASAVTIARYATKIEAVHGAFPDNSSPNSVVPGCAAFDLLSAPRVTVSCSANPQTSTLNTSGNTISWTASVSGGAGSYSYSWTGTDGLNGSSQSVSNIYNTIGTKTATVSVVTSDGQRANANCSASITPAYVPPQPSTLVGTCSVNPSSVNIGGYLNWSASASGGTGAYTYSWTGTDNLSGNSSALSQAYQTAGTKTGTVTITSGNQSVTQTCSAVVNQNITNNLSVSCSPDDSSVDENEDVTWQASVSGGTGSYTYDWSGSENLNGHNQNQVWSYNYSGTKYAYLTVTSGGQSASASCSTRVNSNNHYNNLNVSCYASPSNIQTGYRMNWYVNVYGGDGNYDYDWSGTDGLNSSSRSPSMTYHNPGSKTARVTVDDGNGDSDSATCYVNVNSVLAYSQTYQAPIAEAVYLSQVPYTGFADNKGLYFFVGLLALFSAWIAYIIVARKSQSEA